MLSVPLSLSVSLLDLAPCANAPVAGLHRANSLRLLLIRVCDSCMICSLSHSISNTVKIGNSQNRKRDTTGE